MKLNIYIDYLVRWIKNQVKKAQKKGVVVGISGGIDSAVVATLAKKAFPNNSLGIVIPINKMNKNLQDAKELINKLSITYKIIDLNSTYKRMIKKLETSSKYVNANIKSRLRMITLYAHAQKNNFLVLGTSNLTEWELGYFTKYGDGAADILPIANLTKKNIWKIAKILNIPESIIKKTPSADLWENQTDEKQFGFLYSQVDAYLEGRKVSKKTVQKIIAFRKATTHKRILIPKPNKFIENV